MLIEVHDDVKSPRVDDSFATPRNHYISGFRKLNYFSLFQKPISNSSLMLTAAGCESPQERAESDGVEVGEKDARIALKTRHPRL